MTDAPEMLVPFDGSTAGERLLRHACRVARAEGATLSVLCVVMLPADGSIPANASELDATVMWALTRAQQVCREEAVVAVFEFSHARDLARAIVAEAQRGGATVILLNLEEHERGETALMSPTVQSILMSAPCPVLLNDPATELPPVGQTTGNASSSS